MGLYGFTVLGLAFVFLMTTLGSSVVFIFKHDLDKRFKSLFLGFASGVMIAASIWSLLIPAIEDSEKYRQFKFLPASLGIIVGALFIGLLDFILHKYFKSKKALEVQKKKRVTKLFTAVTLHNIPEGMAVGLAFGLAFINKDALFLASAIGLAVGIGIQNLPEGTALALSIKEETESRKKAFWLSVASGAVEPIFGLLAVIFATLLTNFMPFALSFAAGTMIYVVADELLPEAKDEDSSIGTWGVILGFIVMMVLDVAFS